MSDRTSEISPKLPEQRPEVAAASLPSDLGRPSNDGFKLRIVLHPEEGGYWVEVPGFPGCVSEGDTKEEARCNIREAFLGMLEAMQDRGSEEPGEVEQLEL